MNNFVLGLPGETWSVIIIIIAIVIMTVVTIRKELKKEEAK